MVRSPEKKKSTTVKTQPWKTKERNKENHPTKVNKRIQQKKLKIEVSESPSSSFDFSDEVSAAGSFILQNSRTIKESPSSNKNTTKTGRQIIGLKDVWLESKESVPLPSSMDTITVENSISEPLPKENEIEISKNPKPFLKKQRTKVSISSKPIQKKQSSETILVQDSLTLSEDISSLEPFPNFSKEKTNSIQEKNDSEDIFTSSSEGSIELPEISNSDSIQEIKKPKMNKKNEKQTSETSSSSPLFVDTQKFNKSSNSKQKLNKNKKVVISSDDEEEEEDNEVELDIDLDLSSDDSTSTEVKILEKKSRTLQNVTSKSKISGQKKESQNDEKFNFASSQNNPSSSGSPIRSPSSSPIKMDEKVQKNRSPSSSPKKSNRESILNNLSKRTSPPSSPKQKTKKPKSKSSAPAINSLVGKKRKRPEKTQSMYDFKNDRPLKRQRRTTEKPNVIDDHSDLSSSNNSSVDESSNDSQISSSPSFSLRLSSELLRTMKNKRQKKIFKGFSILLTGIDELEIHEKVRKAFPTCKKLGDLIRRLILSHGGSICSTFIPNSHYRRPHKEFSNLSGSILVSSEPKRTEKYLLGMVYGAPALSFQWVVDCCEAQSILDFESTEFRLKYQLPAGISSLNNSPVYLWETLGNPKDFENPPCIFEGLRSEVVGLKPFRDHWSKILRACGAKVVDRLGSEWETKGRGLELVIADSEAEWVARRCKKLKIPLCSADFIVECILRRELVDFSSFYFE